MTTLIGLTTSGSSVYLGLLPADEHLTVIALKAAPTVPDRDRGRRQPGAAADVILQITPPVGDHERALVVDRVAVVNRLEQVAHLAVPRRHGPDNGVLIQESWRCEQ